MHDVMGRVGVSNPTELAEHLGQPWAAPNQLRMLYKWSRGEHHPNGPSTIALVRAAGLLHDNTDTPRSQDGWNATGLLGALWGKVGGRDKLADLTGIQRSTLSGYNTGRLPLGRKNAEKIAAALDVSVLELGAPGPPDARSLPFRARLEQAEAEAAEARRETQDLAQLVAELTVRVEHLEAHGSKGRAAK